VKIHIGNSCHLLLMKKFIPEQEILTADKSKKWPDNDAKASFLLKINNKIITIVFL
jgi:hypothetical protein